MFNFSSEEYKILNDFKSNIKNNLPLIFLFPPLLGGVQQIIELLIISPSLIRFFSISQLISDGLFILIYFTIIVIIPYLLTGIFYSFVIRRFLEIQLNF